MNTSLAYQGMEFPGVPSVGTVMVVVGRNGGNLKSKALQTAPPNVNNSKALQMALPKVKALHMVLPPGVRNHGLLKGRPLMGRRYSKPCMAMKYPGACTSFPCTTVVSAYTSTESVMTHNPSW